MTRKILVLLEKRDCLEDIVLHLEKLSRPGTLVVFLVRYPVSGFLEWLRDHSTTTDSAREAMRAGRRIAAIYGVDAQRLLAQQRIAPARVALRKKGVKTAVEVRPGPWNRVVQSYLERGDVDLVMVQPRASLKEILGWMVLSSPWSARRGPAPMLLFNPDRSTGALEITSRTAPPQENEEAAAAARLAPL